MKNVYLIIALLISLSIYGQNADDALRYSQTNVIGTARLSSMGGAFGALGGDFSATAINPSGLAIYRKSEFSFSPYVFSSNSNATFNNTEREDFKINYNIGNSGIVMANLLQPFGEAKGWISRNFSLGYIQTNNFNNRISIEGENANSSLLDVYLNKALNNGKPKSPANLDPFGNQLAYNAYLIDDTIGNGSYFSQIPDGTPLIQRKSISSQGSMGETHFAFAGNYNNKLYIGSSVGLNILKFKQVSNYEELINSNNSKIKLESYKLMDELKTTGYGVNLKVGMIYKLSEWFRMGAAFHSPTYYNMSDSWKNSINAKFNTGFDTTCKSPSGNYDYSLYTPAKAIGSLAFVFSKYGILTADYEIIDYSAARLSAKTESYFDQNTIIQNSLKPATNLRIGAELKLNPFSIRSGFNYQGDPYKNNTLDGSRKNYSFGAGIREENYFLDFGYVLSNYSSLNYLYDKTLINPANIKNTNHNFLITLGLNF